MSDIDHFVMCKPDNYTVRYSINPYMDPRYKKVDTKRAIAQWESLRLAIIRAGGTVSVIEGDEDFPDMVYTANAGVFLESTDGSYDFILSEFFNHERTGETKIYHKQLRELFGERANFKQYPANINEGPSFERVCFEGQGDIVYVDDVVLIGHGKRTNFHGAKFLTSDVQNKTHIIKLIDDRWYHLDTCLAYHEFSNGSKLIMYVPKAFNEYDRRLIHQLGSEHDADILQIAADDEAKALVCNSIVVNDTLIIHEPEKQEFETVAKLMDFCNIFTVDLSEFLKGGGSARCLTLDVPFYIS